MRFQAFGVQFTLPFLSLLAPLLCMKLGMRLYFPSLLFALGIHELAHILAARITRVRITEIRIMPFGGSARMENPYGITPLQLFIVSAAGPLSNLLCAVLFAAAAHWQILYPATVARHISIHITLFLFNLLPALPLDGGRILFCILQSCVGRNKALKIGILISWLFAALFIFLPVFAFFRVGKLNLCLLLVAIFILISAKDEQDALQAANAKCMETNFSEPVPARFYQMDSDFSLLDALRLMRPKQASWYLITDPSGKFSIIDGNSLCQHIRSGISPHEKLSTLAQPHFDHAKMLSAH